MENCLKVESLDPRITFSFPRPLGARGNGISVKTNFKDVSAEVQTLQNIILEEFPEGHFFGGIQNFNRQLSVTIKKEGRKYQCRLHYFDGKIDTQITRAGYSDIKILHKGLKKLKKEIKEQESKINNFKSFGFGRLSHI